MQISSSEGISTNFVWSRCPCDSRECTQRARNFETSRPQAFNINSATLKSINQKSERVSREKGLRQRIQRSYHAVVTLVQADRSRS